MVHQDWFLENLTFPDYEDLQNTIHYYTLTHMEVVGHRLIQGVNDLDTRLNHIQFDDMEYVESITTLIEFVAEFERLMMTSHQALFSFYRSVCDFHNGTIQFQVEELLKMTDAEFPKLTTSMFEAQDVSESQMQLIKSLIEEQDAIRNRLLVTINQLQYLERAFLSELEWNSKQDHPTIDVLIQDIRKLLVRDVYEEVYSNSVELAETLIPTIKMPTGQSEISKLCGCMIQHADFLARTIEMTNVGERTTTHQCLIEDWFRDAPARLRGVNVYEQFEHTHRAFHGAAELLSQQKKATHLRQLLAHSAEFLTCFVDVVIELSKKS